MTLLSSRHPIGLQRQRYEAQCIDVDNVVCENIIDVMQVCIIEMCAFPEAPSVGVKRCMGADVRLLTQCQITSSASAGLLGVAV